MIRYGLVCDKGHDFDAWFRSSADYDRTAAAGANVCPVCGSTRVEKALMTPAVGASTRKKGRTAAPEAAGGKMKLAGGDPRRKAALAALKSLRDTVTASADYVGDHFAEEARKIHYEEVEPHGIYGEATGEEAAELIEEGIEFHPLPSLPEDGN